jgi:cytochrome c biogenesis protein CcdA
MTSTEELRVRAAGERTRKAALLAGGLAFGALAAYALYEFFDPVNLFAFRLQEATVGTTNVTTLSVGLALAFVSGVTMIFTPCGMPLVFALNSFALEGRERGRSWVPPFLVFTAGITVVMAVWGAIVGLAGGGIVRFLAEPSTRFTVTEVLYSLLGVLALLMALWEFRWVQLPRLGGHRSIPQAVTRLPRYPRSLAMGAALGGGFGVGCPFPTYQAVLVWAAVVGNPVYGAAVLAANALGRAAPFFVIGGLVYRGAEERRIARWLVGNSPRARLINGTALAAFAGLMLVLWGGLVPFVLKPGR